MKLDIGCGPHPKEGYIGLDIQPFPGVTRIESMVRLPYADQTVESIYCRHALEHLDFLDAELALKDWRRVLVKDGGLRLIVPDIEFHAKQLLYAISLSRNTPYMRPGSKFVEGKSDLEHALAGLYGWDIGPMSHRFGYVKETLELILDEAGFYSFEWDASRVCDLNVFARRAD